MRQKCIELTEGWFSVSWPCGWACGAKSCNALTLAVALVVVEMTVKYLVAHWSKAKNASQRLLFSSFVKFNVSGHFWKQPFFILIRIDYQRQLFCHQRK